MVVEFYVTTVLEEIVVSRLSIKKNKGRSAARGVGTIMSQAKWIGYVDSDDTLPKDAISRLYAKAIDDVDVVLGNGYKFSKGRRCPKISIEEFRHMVVRAEGLSVCHGDACSVVLS